MVQLCSSGNGSIICCVVLHLHTILSFSTKLPCLSNVRLVLACTCFIDVFPYTPKNIFSHLHMCKHRDVRVDMYIYMCIPLQSFTCCICFCACQFNKYITGRLVLLFINSSVPHMKALLPVSFERSHICCTCCTCCVEGRSHTAEHCTSMYNRTRPMPFSSLSRYACSLNSFPIMPHINAYYALGSVSTT